VRAARLRRRRSQAGRKSCRDSSLRRSNVPAGKARRARANKRAADLAPVIAELRAARITSFRGEIMPSGRRHRFEFHADPVEPAPSRCATPTMAIHVQVELLRKTVGICDQKQRASSDMSLTVQTSPGRR
jgi:hypothetical protein